MSAILQMILSMSLTGSVVIVFVLLARFLLRRSPKIFCYVLWSVVLFRLLCPVSFTSSLSLFGIMERESLPSDFTKAEIGPKNQAGTENHTTAAVLPQPEEKQPMTEGASDFHETAKVQKDIRGTIMAGIWLAGMIGMLCYSAYGYLCTRRLFAGGRCRGGNIYEINWEVSPFVFGVVKPKICLPYWLEGQEREYILLHEKTHIKRGDHIIKMLAFLALSLHWFNPLVWLAFCLAEKDMEMACDETVMRLMQVDVRSSYAESLLNLSAGRRRLPGGLLAFGEGSIKERIKNIMHYKKPTVAAVIVAVFALVICAVSLGSNPKDTSAALIADDTEEASEEYAQADGEEKSGDISPAAEKQQSEIAHVLKTWAEAFCGRDGDTIAALSLEEARQSLSERELLEITSGGTSLGFSSPWMWNDEQDYRILEWEEAHNDPALVTAEILYYAWTSDPHVTVWKETLALRREAETFLVESEELQYFDYICTGEEFLSAYPNSIYPGGIRESRMDYLTNGTGQSLNDNALLAGSNIYRSLFSPDTAAVTLLNLLDNQNKVTTKAGEEKEDGSVTVEIVFQEDGAVFEVMMVQPYGDGRYGIWIPQSYEQKAASGFKEDANVVEFNARKISVEQRAIDDQITEGVFTPVYKFAEDCTFLVNTNMAGITYEEISFEEFAGYINAGDDVVQQLCLLTLNGEEVTECRLCSAYYPYGIRYNEKTNFTVDKANAAFAEQYFDKVYEEKADISDIPGMESIEVYIANGRLEDSGYDFSEDDEESMEYLNSLWDGGYVFIKDENGLFMHYEFAGSPRVGWNNIYLGKNSDGAYLMTLHIEDRETYGAYGYNVFRLGEDAPIVQIAGSEFEWGGSYKYDDALFREWCIEMEDYLSTARLLLSSQDGEIRTEQVSEAEKYNYRTLKR